jgi:hypothetical protein
MPTPYIGSPVRGGFSPAARRREGKKVEVNGCEIAVKSSYFKNRTVNPS